MHMRVRRLLLHVHIVSMVTCIAPAAPRYVRPCSVSRSARTRTRAPWMAPQRVAWVPSRHTRSRIREADLGFVKVRGQRGATPTRAGAPRCAVRAERASNRRRCELAHLWAALPFRHWLRLHSVRATARRLRRCGRRFRFDAVRHP
jgi:hypothetical protein